MEILKGILITLLLSAAVLTIVPTKTSAQCPMCRMSAESNLQDGGTEGKGLNKGIFVLLATPYLLVGAIGYVWYRNNRRRSESNDLDSQTD